MIKSIFLIIFCLVLLNTANSQWQQLTNGLYGGYIRDIAVYESNIYVGTGGAGMFRSTDNGNSWNPCNLGLTNYSIIKFVLKDSTLYAATGDGVFVTTNMGLSWNEINNDLDTNCFNQISSMIINSSNIFLGTYGSGIFLSSNFGANWTPVNNGLINKKVLCLTSKGNTIFAGTQNGIFSSSDNGTTWNKDTIGLPQSNFFYVKAIGVADSNIFIQTLSHGTFISSNNGLSWNIITQGLNSTGFFSMVKNGLNTYIATGLGVYLSTDNGNTWQSKSNGLADSLGTKSVTSIAFKNSFMFLGTSDGIAISSDNGDNWTKSNNGLTAVGIWSLATTGTSIFAGSSSHSGLFLSTNNGINWTAVNNGLSSRTIWAINQNGSNIYVGTEEKGVFLSTNNGNNWTALNNGLSNYSSKVINSIAIINSKIYIGTLGGVYLSTNNGINWIEKNVGLIDSTFNEADDISSIAFSGNDIYAGSWSSGNGIYKSTDQGENWSVCNNGLPSTTMVGAIGINGSSIYAGCIYPRKIFKSTNNCVSWISDTINFPLTNFWSFVNDGTNIFTSCDNGVYLSVNNGISWLNVSNGLPEIPIYSLAIKGSYIYAGTGGQGIWKRPLSEMTDVENIIVDDSISIYPNPAKNIITFENNNFAKEDVVSIYNIYGQLLLQQQINNYKIEFDISKFTNGIYFFKSVNGGDIKITKFVKE